MALAWQQSLEVVDGADEDEAEERQTREVLLLVNYDLHCEDEDPPGEEWANRLRLGGIDARRVTMVETSREVKREPRNEPRM
jgi:hypothetical protein